MLNLAAAMLVTSSASAQEFTATHYGEEYNGRGTYCGSVYYSGDTSIVAVGPAYYSSLPCGTPVLVTGTVGSIHAIVQDRCGGCDERHMIDLTESGIIAVCGGLGSCTVQVSRD